MKFCLPAEREKVALLIPAAGRGLRMGGHSPKQYLELLGKPLIVHTLEKFISIAFFKQIVIIVAREEENLCRKILASHFPRHKFTFCLGGAERQQTVAKGLACLDGEINLVCVHDAVRPLVEHALIVEVLKAAASFGAATAAVRVKDTIKICTADGFGAKTLQRDELVAVQTPQAFHRELLEEAHRRAEELNYTATDDSSLVEKLGRRVKLVEGSYTNIKITTPEDMLLAQVLLHRKQGKGDGFICV